MKNNVISEISNKIEAFDIRLLSFANQIIIDTKSLFIDFRYVSQKQAKIYSIGLLFENFKVDKEVGVDIDDLFNLNKLEFKDVSNQQWESVNWFVTDSDDDGLVSLAFYCEQIKVSYIKLLSGENA